MDVWSWVNVMRRDLRAMGRGDVAADFDRFMAGFTDDDVELMIDMGPGLLASAEQLDLPWLEVLTRHWILQGRILSRNEGARALNDAIDALERAHRPAAADCPQTVCTTQDLSLCYGDIDGPGWAVERLAVVDEAVAGIDPSWSCWECMASERVSALEDLGRNDEALAILDRVPAERRAFGHEATPHHRINTVGDYIDLGRPGVALDLLDAHEDSRESPKRRDLMRIHRVQALLALGRIDESTEVFGGPDETFTELTRHVSNADRWVVAAESLHGAGMLDNTWLLGRIAGRTASQLLDSGSYRRAFEAAARHIRLANARNAAWVAADGIRRAEAAAAGLRVPASAEGELSALRESVAGALRHAPVGAADLIAHLDTLDDPDPEEVVEWLEVALVERPLDTDLLERWAWHARMLGGERLVLDEIASRLAFDADQPELARIQLGVLVQGEAPPARFEELASLIDDADPTVAAWARALGARRRNDLEACRRHCADVLALDPEALNTRRLAAAAAADDGDPADAIRLLREVCDRVDPGNDDWELLRVATIAGDWPTVRWSAARLGMDLEPAESPHAPIDERWSIVEIRPIGGAPDGSEDLLAWRTGPVTASILTVTPAESPPQRTRDVVVFDPSPVIPPPAGDPADDTADDVADWTPVFAETYVLERGGWNAWELFGERPDSDRWEALVNRVRSDGWEVWVYSPPTARIGSVEGDGSDARPGFFAQIAAPAAVDAREVGTVLAEAMAGWPERIVHPQLTEEVTDDESTIDQAWGFYHGHHWVAPEAQAG